MTIGKKLISASVISIALFGLLAVTGWLGYRSVMKSSAVVGAYDRESMCLQMLFRGVNETLLTQGSQNSIEVTKQALDCFDEAYSGTLAAERDDRARTEIVERIGLRWEAIRKDLGPYMLVNGVNHDDIGIMAAYGALITSGEALMKEVASMRAEAGSRMERTISQIRQSVVLIFFLILISMVSLHMDMFRSIAVPLKRLRCLMADISGSAGQGRQNGLSSGLLSERLTEKEASLAGRITDMKELVSSFDAMITAVNGQMGEIKAAEGRLRKLATVDGLTQAFNRSMFEEIIGSEIDRANRLKQPLSVIIFDIDRFKTINDSFGHLTGDHVLRTLASIVKEHMRESDYLVRWGGEEFLVVSPGAAVASAVMMAERLRQVMSENAFEYVGAVTASFGVAEYREGESRDSLILRADSAMYNAKRMRNKVERAA